MSVSEFVTVNIIQIFIFKSRRHAGDVQFSMHNTCRFFSGVSLPPDFLADPYLKIPSKLRETFKVVRSEFEQRLLSEQSIVSNSISVAYLTLS